MLGRQLLDPGGEVQLRRFRVYRISHPRLLPSNLPTRLVQPGIVTTTASAIDAIERVAGMEVWSLGIGPAGQGSFLTAEPAYKPIEAVQRELGHLEPVDG